MHLIPLNCSLETGQDGKFYGYLITIKKNWRGKKEPGLSLLRERKENRFALK